MITTSFFLLPMSCEVASMMVTDFVFVVCPCGSILKSKMFKPVSLIETL